MNLCSPFRTTAPSLVPSFQVLRETKNLAFNMLVQLALELWPEVLRNVSREEMMTHVEECQLATRLVKYESNSLKGLLESLESCFGSAQT